MTDISWTRYPMVSQLALARTWLQIQTNLGLAPHTIETYGRALEDYLSFCYLHEIIAESATRGHILQYVHHLTSWPNHTKGPALDSGAGLANATLHQGLTAVRLWYDYLIEEGLRQDNPVAKGCCTAGKEFGGMREKGLLPRFHKLPWIPSEEQWQAILEVAKEESSRNRVMFAFAYDAALRREELCALTTSDLDPVHRLVRIRVETKKNLMERVVPYSEETRILYTRYLQERRTLSHGRGPLFLSEADRNLAQPVTIWTWSKVVKGIAQRAHAPHFTTYTFRHLCLTDLARSGWDLHEIATFAGHRSLETTMLYIHLSGRDFSDNLQKGMQSIHRW